MAAEDVLAGLDFETPKTPTIMCDGKVQPELGGVVFPPTRCPFAARHSITCVEHGETFLCSAHRVKIRAEDVVCGSSWYEAVIS